MARPPKPSTGGSAIGLSATDAWRRGAVREGGSLRLIQSRVCREAYQKQIRTLENLTEASEFLYAAFEGTTEIRKSCERPHFGHVKILSPVGFPNGGISTVSSVSLPQT